jgi:hypothetical protein
VVAIESTVIKLRDKHEGKKNFLILKEAFKNLALKIKKPPIPRLFYHEKEFPVKKKLSNNHSLHQHKTNPITHPSPKRINHHHNSHIYRKQSTPGVKTPKTTLLLPCSAQFRNKQQRKISRKDSCLTQNNKSGGGCCFAKGRNRGLQNSVNHVVAGRDQVFVVFLIVVC